MDRPITEREIYLTKRSRVILDEDSGECPVSVVATLGQHLESLGFIPSKALFERLRTLSIEDVNRFYGEVTADLHDPGRSELVDLGAGQGNRRLVRREPRR